MLKYQNQNADITVLDGIKEYREYLELNNKDKLQDFEGSQLIRDHDATHVIFGLDTTLAQWLYQAQKSHEWHHDPLSIDCLQNLAIYLCCFALGILYTL